MPKWVKFIIAILLLPICVGAARTLWLVLRVCGSVDTTWVPLGAGAACWVIIFLMLPKPMWIYVFGHELTHALWTWLFGGEVKKMKVSSKGGHVVISKTNFLIALAPYFFPLYSILVIVIYGVAGLFCDVTPYHRWLYGLIGATWAFHSTFTLWMIPKGQSDLSYHGTFFSLVVIYLMNLLVLTIFLLVASPRVTTHVFIVELYHNILNFSAWVCSWVR